MSPSERQVVLVTGANQGLGLSIIRVAALRDPAAVYIIACRNVESGHEAVSKLQTEGVKADIEVLKLDVTNDLDVMDAVSLIDTKHGKLDVLINNAGINPQPADTSLSALREAYNSTLNVNISSVAVVSTAFYPLLSKAANPKVINITSGLASMTNVLNPAKKILRYVPYGASKVGVNGLTVHMQVRENDKENPKVKFYAAAPGLLKTAFTNYLPFAKEPDAGAEVVVRLMADKGNYEGGTQWGFEGGEMQAIPW
ncbi:MAG: hypothetical protein M1818_004299 [Claussenomyces sp. TS43310]|nr:MAG: hypothetical protein M1818_004299 [Claussenomyces sp. TS43310]